MPLPKPYDRQVCFYIGVDPGDKGGIAVIGMTKELFIAEPMPSTERGKWELLSDYQRAYGLCTAVIEKVHQMPEQSAQSGFTFGWGYGGLRMALIACKIAFEEITPQSWMKAMGVPVRVKTGNTYQDKKEGKLVLLKLAQQLFPDLPLWSETKSKGKQLAVADALLIAEFCRRKNLGLLK